jgi:hypothetical protein
MPHETVHREIDGYIVDPANPDRVPPRIAAMIHAAEFGGDSVRDIRDRMLARQRALEHRQKRYCAVTHRMMKARRA